MSDSRLPSQPGFLSLVVCSCCPLWQVNRTEQSCPPFCYLNLRCSLLKVQLFTGKVQQQVLVCRKGVK